MKKLNLWIKVVLLENFFHHFQDMMIVLLTSEHGPNLSFYVSIYLSIYLSIYPSIYLSIYSSIRFSIWDLEVFW